MKILFLSRDGDGLDIALRMAAQGDDIKAWVQGPKSQDVYDGLVAKVKHWQQYVSWADLAVFDHTKMHDIWKQVKRRVPCFGGHDFAERLEADRNYGRQIMEDAGFNLMESLTFKTVAEVAAHLKMCKKPHVLKPFGGKVKSEHIFVGRMETNEDTLAMLYHFEQQRVPFEAIEVEERKFGIEVGIGCWFNGKDWILPVEVNFEHKNLANHELGFKTGEMGTCTRYDLNPKNRLFQETLEKIAPALRAADYHGQIDLNCICDFEGRIWPLEWTARLGYPSIFLQDELQKTPWAKLFSAVAKGEAVENEVSQDWGVAVVVVTPGFPVEEEVKQRSQGTPIFNVGTRNIKHIHLVEARVGLHAPGQPGLVTTAGQGYPCVVTASRETLDEASEKVYGRLDQEDPENLYIPGAWWRTDIGTKVIRVEDKIADLGLLTSFPYSQTNEMGETKEPLVGV